MRSLPMALAMLLLPSGEDITVRLTGQDWSFLVRVWKVHDKSALRVILTSPIAAALEKGERPVEVVVPENAWGASETAIERAGRIACDEFRQDVIAHATTRTQTTPSAGAHDYFDRLAKALDDNCS